MVGFARVLLWWTAICSAAHERVFMSWLHYYLQLSMPAYFLYTNGYIYAWI
jgi:hypothetical protein